MKSFTEMFVAARSISTPLIAVRTFDPSSTINNIVRTLGDELVATLPLVSWDSIHGLKGLNDVGVEQVAKMCNKADDGAGVERGATVDLAICLAVMEEADADVLAFIHNPQLVWNTDKKVVQAQWNLRNPYKANGNMLVNLIGTGDDIPAELQQDMLILEEPLPTRTDLAKIVTDTFAYAAQKPEYKACKTAATPEVIKSATDALIGLPAFPAEQATSMCLDMNAGKLDIETLWSRKKDIVSQNPGLTYHAGRETLKDMYGCAAWVKFAERLMKGPKQPTVIVRMDEIQRQLAGSESDSSGTKGNLMGEFLTWVNDHNVICTLNVGVSGTSKSWGPYCIGGEHNKPIVNYSVSAMEHKHIGESSRHMRTAHKVLDSISDNQIWLIASANSLEGLPPELISRFQRGGIFFFDLPDDDEKAGILTLKLKAYGLDPNQERPTMQHWTGRDIDNCCGRAQLLGISVAEASQDIIPLHQSHNAMIENIRSMASGKYLSASKPGTYHYVPEPKTNAPSVKIVEGRKMR
jgi:hypothetical protein